VTRFAVVVNDCAAPPVAGILPIRTRNTGYGEPNFTLRFDDLAHGLPAQLGSRELDWLEILGHLFAIDLACERGRGDLEWSRSIQAWLPVRDPDYWTPRRAAIEGIWTDLTDDELQLRFEQADDPAPPPRMGRNPYPEHDGVALISGGQDSFVGALDLISAGRRLLLLSHTASGATNTAQSAVEEHLRGLDAGLVRMRLSARRRAQGGFPGAESSQRSRTLLFVGAACVVAAAGGSCRVWLNENGIMAVHVPLTPARLGSLSTHTASPPILERMRALASEVLGAEVWVDNHIIGLTKPEVVGHACELGFAQQLRDTVSCWQIGRTHTHCGTCAPCLLRRISCETHDVPDVPYAADVFDDPSAIDDPQARDNLAHLVSLVQDLQELSDLELEYEYPELISGEPALTLADTISMHRRWAQQAAGVLFAHPVPASIQ
jgi:hypothetical protein